MDISAAAFVRAFNTLLPWLAPALLLFASILHSAAEGETIIDSLSAARSTWLFVHVLQVFAFGFLGILLTRLAAGEASYSTLVVRISAFVFAIFYIAADAVGGIGSAIVLDIYARAPELDFVTVEGLLYSLLESDVSRTLFFTASSAWLVALLTLAWRAFRARSFATAGLYVVAGCAFFIGHGEVYGSITAFSLIGAALISTLKHKSVRIA